MLQFNHQTRTNTPAPLTSLTIMAAAKELELMSTSSAAAEMTEKLEDLRDSIQQRLPQDLPDERTLNWMVLLQALKKELEWSSKEEMAEPEEAESGSEEEEPEPARPLPVALPRPAGGASSRRVSAPRRGRGVGSAAPARDPTTGRYLKRH